MKASILVPVLNEEDFIENCLLSIISKTRDLSDMEILVIDGGSEDKTLDIVQNLIKQHAYIKLLHNPKKITPAALNIGIKNAKGKYIIRLDAHAEYYDNYIENSIEALERSDETIVNVGGPIATSTNNSSLFAKAISLCLSSIFGVGNSKFRTTIPSEPITVETVPFGCFRREIFDEIGLFNEQEPRNEDLEFNRRIINSGKKILLDPKVRSTYFSRSNLKSLILQQFDNGKIVTNKFRGRGSFHNIRHFIPLIFFMYLISLVPLSFVTSGVFAGKLGNIAVYFYPLIFYLMLSLYFSSSISFKTKQMSLLFPSMLGFTLIHLSYGMGSFFGLFLFEKKKSFPEFMEIVFPYKTTFERKHFGFFTNLIKYFSLRFAYLLYCMRISANSLTFFSVLLTIPCFLLLYEGILTNNFIYLLGGYILIGSILFIDFVDGSLARIDKYTYAAGDALDNLPPDIIRIGSILFFGVITSNQLYMLLAFISSIVISYYLPATLENIQEKRKWIHAIYASRMAITGLRIISLLLMPVLTLSVFLQEDLGILFAKIVVLVYFFLSLLWVMFTLEDRDIKD
jgi:glycosyltransferase involved in cell wall biosynthesis